MQSKIVLSAFLILLLTACAGSRGSLRFNELKYPASTSAYLYKKGKPVVIGYELTKLKSINYRKKHWGILYTLISLSDEKVFVKVMNEEIARANGDGLVNVSFKVDSCYINSVPIFNLLPFWPGCTEVTLTGDVVKYK